MNRTYMDFYIDIRTESERIQKFIEGVEFQDFLENDEKIFRRAIIMLFLIFLIPASCFAQPDSVKGGFTKCEVYFYDYINEKAKELESIAFYNESGIKIENISYEDNLIKKRSYFEYDSNGTLVSQENCDSNGVIWYQYKKTTNDSGYKKITINNDFYGSKYKTIESYNKKGFIFESLDILDTMLSSHSYYFYNKNDLLSNEFHSNLVFDSFFSTIYKYDIKGNMIEKYFKRETPKVPPYKEERQNKYKYDRKGRISEEVIEYESTIGNYNKTIFYQYNNCDSLSELLTVYNNAFSACTKYEYDDNCNLVEETEYSTDDSLNSRIRYFYNDSNDLIRINSQVFRCEYIYVDDKLEIKEGSIEIIEENKLFNKYGVLNKRTLYNGDGKIDQQEEFNYDSNELLIEEKYYDSYHDCSSKLVYKYDNHQNITEVLIFQCSNNPTEKQIFIYSK